MLPSLGKPRSRYLSTLAFTQFDSPHGILVLRTATICFCLFLQIEREVTEAMMKSLKYCDLQTESARQPLYQYRAATIHHRLASMYHSCYRNQVGMSLLT